MKQKLKGLKKRKIDKVVTAKVFAEDLETLKANEINVSKLIRETVFALAKDLRKNTSNR